MQSHQPNLFDHTPPLPSPEQAKHEAIRRVEENANQDFLACAYQVLCEVARRKPEFSARDVWDAYLSVPGRPETHQPRAMGVVFMRASKDGLIKPTNNYVKSGRRSDHNQNLRVWVSLVYGGGRR